MPRMRLVCMPPWTASPDAVGAALGASGRVVDESLAACTPVVPAQATQYRPSTPDKSQGKMPGETNSKYFLILLPLLAVSHVNSSPGGRRFISYGRCID